MNGYGINEVIIESPLHNDHLCRMSESHIEQVIRAYHNRYHAAMANRRIEVVMLFKNYGPTAGCSQAHPHSQMAAVPVVPTNMRVRIEQAKRYYDDTGLCVYCVMMKDEVKTEERVVYKNDSFVIFCPYASGAPFEVWIIPRRHTSNFGEINEKEMKDLAAAMKDLFSRYYYGLEDPDFNFVIRTAPRDETNDRCMHWYIMAMPRLTKVAGFELGTGMFINVTLPEANAKFLREIKIPV
jgi:UDPglucose--hexose-1-phosphate uridylyltransferase